MNERAISISFIVACTLLGLASVIAGICYLKIHAVLIGFAFLWFAKVFHQELKDERNQ
jgi:hypothetical protein